MQPHRIQQPSQLQITMPDGSILNSYNGTSAFWTHSGGPYVSIILMIVMLLLPFANENTIKNEAF